MFVYIEELKLVYTSSDYAWGWQIVYGDNERLRCLDGVALNLTPPHSTVILCLARFSTTLLYYFFLSHQPISIL